MLVCAAFCWSALSLHSRVRHGTGRERIFLRKIRAQLLPLATAPHYIQHRIYHPAEFTLAKTASRSPLGLSRQWIQIQHRTFFKINQIPIPQSKSPISPRIFFLRDSSISNWTDLKKARPKPGRATQLRSSNGSGFLLDGWTKILLHSSAMFCTFIE
jgi:hypothetical protein